MSTAPDCHPFVLEMENVSFAYENRRVADGLSWRVRERDFCALVGPNGSGKTTLLKLAVGLLRPHKGTVRLFGRDLSSFRDWRRVGYMPQRSHLNPLFPTTVREVVLSGLYGRDRMFRRLTAEDRRRAEEAMEALGVAGLAERRIGRLSGGQQQRVLLARAIVRNPDLLLLDEPTAGLDAETQAAFFAMLRHMHERHRLTIVLVTHDREPLRDVLESEPVFEHGGLRAYARHAHSAEDCGRTDLVHGFREAWERVSDGRLG